jgi:glycosyltransferase involved in cell wall biosynthesis
VKKSRLAYVSSIPCSPTFGGPLQIYRHFAERNDFEFFDFTDETATVWEQWVGTRWANKAGFQRLKNTRLHPYLLAAASATRLEHSAKELMPKVGLTCPDAIVTVAYGRKAFVAQRIARKLELPLITFFHDWWPDLLHGLTPATRGWLDKKMRLLARSSALVLSVSQELLAELEPHPKAAVLLPIPAPPAFPLKTGEGWMARDVQLPLLVYAGTLCGDYGAMILDLANELIATSCPQWRLKAYGNADDWSATSRKRLTEAGIYGGFLKQGAQLDSALAQANALLVTMDFRPENRRRVRTSFPSKLLDYSAHAKPLVIWGPEECSASGFVRARNAGYVVNNRNPRDVRIAVEALFSDTEQCVRFGQAARQLSRTLFNPDVIHQDLKRHFTTVLNP